MQNTETMTPDAQPIPTSPVEIPTPQKHNKINILVLSIIFLLLGSTSFFAYQYIQLKQQVNSKPTTSPTPFASPKPTAEAGDPTANWKTYTNNFYHLELKYPGNYSLDENSDKIEINSPLSKCNPALVFNIEEYKQMREVQIIIKKRYGFLEKILEEEGGKNYGWDSESFNGKRGFSIAVGAEMITPYTRFLVEGYQEEVLDIQAYVFASDDQGRCIPKLDSGNASIVGNQILSTFKFLDQPTTTPTAKYSCPASGWVDCMPGPDSKPECSTEAMTWYKANCPNFKGGAL